MNKQNQIGHQNYWPTILLLLYGAVWVVTAINPVHWEDWLLENLLVVVWLAVLICTYRRFRFSTLSYVMITLMLSLHALGAHYTYAEMPFGNWLRHHFELARNPYDRIVHFLFGLLIAYPLFELVFKKFKLTRGWSYVLSVHIILGWSALFEVLEGLVAYFMSPELAAAYNAVQGDIWDAQKDTALAMLGAVIAMAITALVQYRKAHARSAKHRTEVPSGFEMITHRDGMAKT
jgi:putative membrane protein